MKKKSTRIEYVVKKDESQKPGDDSTDNQSDTISTPNDLSRNTSQVSNTSEKSGSKVGEAASLLATVKRDKKIKAVERTIPFMDQIVFYDLSVEGRGGEEDRIYAMGPWYRSYIRRGNTLAVIWGDKGKDKETIYARKGFEKFFDLSYEYIQYNLGEMKDFSEKFGLHEEEEHHNLHGVIFDKAKKALQNGEEVTVYKLVKANGENAQVSWSEKLRGWVIASKNVGLLAREERDLELYSQDRYYFARLIGEVWFKIVKRLTDEGKIEDLKKEMNGRTFVGEYCGNQEHQHLVKYKDICILFVAVVDNESLITCLPPEESIGLFKKYGLDHVNYQKYDNFKDWTTFNLALKKIFTDVAVSDIEVEEEGSVLYFVKKDKEGRQETLSLSKLKTMEYRVYRKLREKLRNYASRYEVSHRKNQLPPNADTLFNKFVKETEELCRDNPPPNPLGYYFYVGRAAFDYVSKYPNDCKLLQERYITFLNALLYCVENDIVMDPKFLKNEKKLAEIALIPWTSYKNHKEEYLKKSYSIKNGGDEESKIDSSRGGLPQTVYIIVPMGIPGMGKSTLVSAFRDLLKKYDASLDVISSDETRAECMERLAKQNKSLTPDQLFEKTGKDAAELFKQRLSTLIANAHKKRETNVFIFIDKNHPPNALKGTFELINSNGSHLNKRVVCLTPITQEKYTIHEKKWYPFSLEFFLNCFKRVQDRKEHPTLTGSGLKSAAVMFMFFDWYERINLNDESIKKNGFDLSLRIPFVRSDRPRADQFPQKLREKVEAVLKISEKDKERREEAIKEFIAEFEKSDINFEFPKKSEITEALTAFMEANLTYPGQQKPANQISEPQGKKEEEEEKKETKIVEKKQGQKKGGVRFEEFNPTQTPLYLGIFEKTDSSAVIRDYIIVGLKRLLEEFSGDVVLGSMLKEFESGKITSFKFIKDYHITTFYMGKKKENRKSDLFKNFEEGLEMNMEIRGIAIVPNCIVAGICFPDQSRIKIDNKYPHITMMEGAWAPVASNFLLEAVCGDGGFAWSAYTKGEFLKKGSFAMKGIADVVKQKQKVMAYVVKLDEPLVIPGVTKAIF